MTKNATAVALLAALSSTADARPKRADPARGAPVLAQYSDTLVDGELWNRAELSRRDRSLVTVAALTAAGRTSQLRLHLALALDHGVTPLELSPVTTAAAWSTSSLAPAPPGTPILAARR